VRDVDDLQSVLVGAREGVLPAGQRRELDVRAEVRRAAVVDGVRQVLDVAHVGAVLVALLGARGGREREQCGQRGQRDESSPHENSDTPAMRNWR